MAVALYDAARIHLTHNYILAEFVALAQARKFPRAAALTFIASLCRSPAVELVWIDSRLHDAAMRLLQSQEDKSYSLCDAVSFLLMRERGIYDALTTDHHFEQAGFRRLLPDDHP
jgi:predicted nucleic acid-binding protein